VEPAVLVLSLAAFASAGALRAVDPLLPLLAAHFGTTAGGASAAITAFAVAYGALQVVNGPLGDRVGKYRMVFIVTAISAAGNLACALAPPARASRSRARSRAWRAWCAARGCASCSSPCSRRVRCSTARSPSPRCTGTATSA